VTTPAGAVAGNAQAAQRDAGQRERAQPQPAGGTGFFGRKYGPLKGWQWSIAAGGLALAYFWWRSRSKAATSATATSSTGTGTGYAGQIAALQQEIDQLQGQSATSTTTGPTTGTSTGTTKSGHPNAPVNLHTIRVGAYAVRVGWEPGKVSPSGTQSNTGTFYDVALGSGPPVTTTGTQHSFTVKPGTSYTWKVREHVSGQASPWAQGSFKSADKKHHHGDGKGH
jgi:hypothetical protein